MPNVKLNPLSGKFDYVAKDMSEINVDSDRAWLDGEDAQTWATQTERRIDDWVTSNTSIYLDASGGNDDTGDGTVTLPYATIDRAFLDIPVNLEYQRSIYLEPGTYTWDKDYTQGFKQARINFYGSTSVDENWVVSGVNASDRDNGTQLTITGASFSVNEHRGKLIKYTSGALNGKYGVIYANDATDIWCTSENTSGTYTIPAVSDTLDLISNDSTINVTAAKRNSIRVMRFYNCDFTGSFFRGAMSALTYWYCTCGWQQISAGPDSVHRNICSYWLGGSGSVALAVGRDATARLNRGAVVDGADARKIEILTKGTLAIQNEVVITRIPSQYFTLSTHSVISSDEYSATGNTLRFYDTDTGVYVPAGAMGGQINLPYCAGTIDGDWLIEIDSTAANYLGNLDGGSVTTDLGTNTCTVDGTNEGYENDDGDIQISGIQSIGRYSDVLRTATATDYTVTEFDYNIGVTDTSVARTITLPPLADVSVGKIFIVDDESAGAGTNNITVAADGAENINGESSIDIIVDGGSMIIKKAVSEWKTI